MDTIDEKVGYLLAKVEEQQINMNKIAIKLDVLTDLVEKKFAVAETTFKVVKFIGIAVAAILTFKFGDITKWWAYFFTK